MESRDTINNEKFVQCYMKYSITIARYLRQNFIENFAEAMEMSHDIFVRLYERNIHLDPSREGMYTYLVRIARNHAIDIFRKKKIRDAVVRTVPFEDVVPCDQLYKKLEDAYIDGEVIIKLHYVIV